MATQGPNLPTAASTVNQFSGNNWSNPTNIEGDDGAVASCNFSGFTTQGDGLVGSGFGFSIPGSATILGITVTIKRAQLNGTAGSVQDHLVSLQKAGSNIGTNKAGASTWPASLTVATYGSGSDLWGTSWTPSDINASNFGIYLDAVGVARLGVTGDVDYFKITVTYTNSFNDTVTATVTVGATESSKLSAVGSETNNVALGAIHSAKLSAVASISQNVTVSDQETGIRTPTGWSQNINTGVVISVTETTAGSISQGVTLGGTQSGGLALTASDSENVILAGYMTAQVTHAPLPCSDISEYLSLITSEHNERPKFMAFVALLVQAMRDCQCLLKQFTTLFDIQQAQGDQLDIIGQWVGITRNIAIPLQNTVFFSWNTSGLGWNQGKWFGPGDTLVGYVTLADAQYRTLLLARIASNMWDGTVPGAYAIWSIVFSLQGFQLLIQDNQDMSISIIFLSNTVDAITQSLLVNGYLTFRPAGVRIAGYFKATPPIFGWGVNNNIIGGWGIGSWLSTTQIG